MEREIEARLPKVWWKRILYTLFVPETQFSYWDENGLHFVRTLNLLATLVWISIIVSLFVLTGVFYLR